MVNHIAESIGCLGIRGALDGDGTLIVRLAGAAPASVLLLDVEGNAAVPVDAVVRACLALDVHKPVSQILRRPLADHAVRRDPVDAERSEAGMIRAQFCIHHHRAVRIWHDASPPFAAGACVRRLVPHCTARAGSSQQKVPPAGLWLSAGGRRTLPLMTAPRQRKKEVDLQAALWYDGSRPAAVSPRRPAGRQKRRAVRCI